MIRHILCIITFLTSGVFSAPNIKTNSSETTVYICVTGEVYHKYKDCRGLKNATSKIKAISLSDAKKTRRPCKICY